MSGRLARRSTLSPIRAFPPCATRLAWATLVVLAAAACDESPHRAPLDGAIGVATPDSGPAAYPFDPLDSTEIRVAAGVLRAAGILTGDRRLAYLSLLEPSKAAMQRVDMQSALDRQAVAIVADLETNTTIEAVVNISRRRIMTRRALHGTQAPWLRSELEIAATALQGDSTWNASLRRRGVDGSHVQIVAAPSGYPAPDSARRVRVLGYLTDASHSDLLARPLEGLTAVVNINTRRVERVMDLGARPIPAGDDIAPPAYMALDSVPDISTVVPNRTWGLAMRGRMVAWHGWEFRVGLNAREGLVLYQVSHRSDENVQRRILYRASLAEMLVPYAATDSTWYWRGGFDVGEAQLGSTVQPLTPSIDAPPDANYIDAVLATEDGQPVIIRRAAAVFERPAGVGWRHEDMVRPSRELVVLSTYVVGNYDYSFAWIFKEDGSIRVQVSLNGVMWSRAEGPTGPSSAGASRMAHDGALVAHAMSAIMHQHFFCFRLDFDLGAGGNTVSEVSTSAAAGAERRTTTGFAATERVLAREGGAGRDVDVATNRYWRISNSSVHNRLGTSIGYELLPGSAATPYFGPASGLARRAGFVAHQFWVSAYADDELYPAGAYVNQSTGADGLDRWQRRNRPLADRDIVVWYTLGLTHHPRPEEWPVMSQAQIGFDLLPSGFFSRNPQVPPRR